MPERAYRARSWSDQTANSTDQCSLAGSVGPKQREYFTLPDLQINAVQRFETTGIDFAEAMQLSRIGSFIATD